MEQKDETKELINMAGLFGPIGKDAYQVYAQQKIETQFGNISDHSGREARDQLWHNYDELNKAIAATPKEENIVGVTYEYIKGLSGFARNQLENYPAGGLGIHLKEITQFSQDFFLDDKMESRFPQIISTHNALLLANVISPMHDVLKFLGSTDAQVMPDHETITADFVRNNFVGRKVMFGKQPHILTQQDVEFVAGVIGDHENIEKEEGRKDFISSTHPTDRAKALFFIADVLTGVIVPNPDSIGFIIDSEQLDARFTDLYFRHIDLVKGKIFRPQWGAYAIGDLLTTFDVLEQQGLIVASEDRKTAQETLVDAAIESINRARLANKDRVDHNFSVDQLEAINAAEQNLLKYRET